MSIYEITKNIHELVNDLVEIRVRSYIEATFGMEFANKLEETCKKNVELEEKLKAAEERIQSLKFSVNAISAIYAPPGTTLGWGHAGPCKENCDCDVAKAKK